MYNCICQKNFSKPISAQTYFLFSNPALWQTWTQGDGKENEELKEFIVLAFFSFFPSSPNVAINYRRFARIRHSMVKYLHNDNDSCWIVDVVSYSSQKRGEKVICHFTYERNWLNSCGFMQIRFISKGSFDIRPESVWQFGIFYDFIGSSARSTWPVNQTEWRFVYFLLALLI